MPEGLVAVLPVLSNILFEVAYIVEYLGLSLKDVELLLGFIGCWSGLLAVAIVVIDNCGGVGVVVLHIAYLDFLERVASTGIAFYFDIHNAFFLCVQLSVYQSERKKKLGDCFLPWFRLLNVVPLHRQKEINT